ncbi:MAG: hypothetical protein K2M87_05100 [Muribaculaceae bacterium]|nr:hypothetical protein [Muribaculaceae bacterium]
MKTTLKVEESARLIELGVDAKLASCREFVDKTEENSNQFLEIEELPRFTITDLLSILPKEIKIHRDGDTLSMIYHCGQWRVGYTNCAEYCDHTKVAPELIDALNQLAIYCLESGNINLNQKKQWK